MRHFKRHRLDVNIDPILEEISANPSAWATQTGRQHRVAVQAETNAIPIRGLRRSRIMGRRRRDVHETRYTSLASRFPETVALLERLAEDLHGRVGRAKLARLPPGARVLPHVDRGEYYIRRDRYHLVVDSSEGSTLTAGDEEVGMRPGELWWFDNKVLHSARNNSKRPRVHLVFDVQPADGPVDSDAMMHPLSDPRDLLAAGQCCPCADAPDSVVSAVELYLAIRANPCSWDEVLKDYDCVERAQRQPLEVLTQLLWPALDAGRRKRRESAVAWALAQLDLGHLTVRQLPGALQEVGGIRQLHDIWRSSKDQLLYGSL